MNLRKIFLSHSNFVYFLFCLINLFTSSLCLFVISIVSYFGNFTYIMIQTLKWSYSCQILLKLKIVKLWKKKNEYNTLMSSVLEKIKTEWKKNLSLLFPLSFSIGWLNIHRAHVTAINSTNNNIGCFNIYKAHMTAINSTNNNIGCFNIHRAHVTAINSTNNNIGCFNIHRAHVTAINSTNNNIGCFNIHRAHVTAINSTNNNIGCFNIHRAHVTANNSTNNNVVFFFYFKFENSVLSL